MSRRTFIVYTPGYNEQTGGVMALFGLAYALREIGTPVFLWPADISLAGWWAWESKRRARVLLGREHDDERGETSVWPGEPIPYANPFQVQDAIVVYPETLDGNPLKAKNVVRWFLNKPGALSGRINFGPGELYFYFASVFDDPAINPHRDNHLMIMTVMDNIYKQTNFGPRNGTCYVLRKGKSRAPDPGTLDGPIVDGMTAHQIAEVFNRCELCVSYDTRTMLTAYAVLCGCKAVVIPEPGVTKAQWAPKEDGMYGEQGLSGIAYGFDDLEEAQKSKPQLAIALKKLQQQNLDSTQRFRDKCEAFFAAKD